MFNALRSHLTPALALLLLAPLSSAAPAPLDKRGPRVQARVSASGFSLRIGNRHGSLTLGTQPFRYRSCDTFRAGHYQLRNERVWVQGQAIQTWIPARYEWRTDRFGSTRQVLVQAGYYQLTYGPGCYQTVARKVWVPGRRVCRTGRHHW